MAFLDIALEWLCDEQHNRCYYSFRPSTHFSLYLVHHVIIAELGVNPRLWFLAVTDVTVPSTGSNWQSVNWPPQSLSRFMESLRGHRRLPREAVQGAELASELWLGNFWPLQQHNRFINSAFVQRPQKKCRFMEKLYSNGSWTKILHSSCGD